MVSIIMPTYNRAYIIERAIRSVISQTYKDWELIVVDDASQDDTKEGVKKYAASNIRYYRNQRNLGANASRNIGVTHAEGDMLAFLDSDNYWPEYKLELQMELMKRNQKKRCFLYGKASVADGGEIRIYPESIYSPEELKTKEMLGNILDLNTLLIKKEIFEEAGAFDEELMRFQDWELILRLMYCYEVEAIGCERILSYNEIQENSIGRNASYVEACGSILKKYMCSFLPEKYMVDYLIGIWNVGKKNEELARKTIREIGTMDARLLPESIRLLVELQNILENLQNKLQVSCGMEKLLYEWHKENLVSREGTLFSNYFCEDSSIKRIAVYGLGKLGKIFLYEIKKLPVDVVYLIDRKEENFEGRTVRKPEEIEMLEPVDLVIVAVLNKAKEIKCSLSRKYKGKIVTLAELIKKDEPDGKTD